MFRSPLRSFWALVAWLLPTPLAIMGWDDALIAAIVAGLAATGSAAASNKANNARLEAQAEAERNDRFRQAELQRQSDEDVRRGIEQFTPEKQAEQVKQATDVRTQALQTPQVPVDQYAQAAPSTPKEVGNDLSRRLASVATHARQEAASRASLGAYGDASQQEGFDMNRLRDTLARRRQQSVGSSSILPYELRETANVGRGLQNSATALGIASQIAGAYSIGSKPKAGAATSSVAPTPGGYGDVY